MIGRKDGSIIMVIIECLVMKKRLGVMEGGSPVTKERPLKVFYDN